MVGAVPVRQVVRHVAPRRARAHNVEDRVEDLAPRQRRAASLACAALAGRKQTLDERELLVGQVSVLAAAEGHREQAPKARIRDARHALTHNGRSFSDTV